MQLLPTAETILDSQGSTVDFEQLYDAYDFPESEPGSAAAFSCDEGGFLFGVSTCWAVNAKGTASHRTACPESVLGSNYSASCKFVSQIHIRAAPAKNIFVEVWLIASASILFVLLALVLISKRLRGTNKSSKPEEPRYQRLAPR